MNLEKLKLFRHYYVMVRMFSICRNIIRLPAEPLRVPLFNADCIYMYITSQQHT